MVSAFFFSATALLASTAITPVLAQVYTDCNPLNVTCPPNPALGTEFTQHFNATPKEGIWNVTMGTIDYDENQGAGFTINKKGDAPTIRSNFYFFFGRTEVWLKVAPGAGVISSIVWLSDILDEVDWEFFGSNTTHAQTNWFGRGEPDFTNAIYHPMDTSPLDDYHNYTNTWTADQMDFYIDGQHVRTVLPEEANGGENYPQTPMRFSLGIWAAGDPDQPEGTREWAQGITDYNEGPFTMWIRSASVQDYSSGKEYIYTDNSGDWQSIEIVEGNSTAKEAIERPREKSMSEKWNDLPQATKTGVYIGGVGAAALIFGGIIFYCIRQRRRGAREAAAAEKRAEAERMELDGLRGNGINPDGLLPMYVPGSTEYKPPGSSSSSYRGGTPMEEKAWDPTANSNSNVPLLSHNASQRLPGELGPLYSDSPASPPGRLATPGPRGNPTSGDHWQGR